MNIIHMETDQTIQAAQNLSQACEQMRQRVQNLRANIDGVEWSGDSHEMFVTEFRQFSSGFEQQLQAGFELGERVKREVDQWISGDAAFGDGAVGNASEGSLLVDDLDPNSEFGQVLGAIDIAGELNQKPGLLAWAKKVFDIIGKIFGRESAKGLLPAFLRGAGVITSGVGLVASVNDVNNTSDAWREMLNLYGANDPRTLAARMDYSSAELEQLLGFSGMPIEFVAKVSGKWGILVDMYDEAKYEGPPLLEAMNFFDPPNVE